MKNLLLGLLYAYTFPILTFNSAYVVYKLDKGDIKEDEVQGFIYKTMTGTFIASTVFWIAILIL